MMIDDQVCDKLKSISYTRVSDVVMIQVLGLIQYRIRPLVDEQVRTQLCLQLWEHDRAHQ
jgi:hypothetical protein